MTLSSDGLATLLSCELAGSTVYPVEMWKLFIQKFAGVLEDALSKDSIEVGHTPVIWKSR